MKALRIAVGVWTWRGAALVMILMLAPLLSDDGIRIAVLAVLTCALAASLLWVDELSGWGRAVTVTGILLLGTGFAIGGVATLPVGLLGGVVTAGCVVALLRGTIDEEKQKVQDLHLRLRTAEVGRRQDRARLHEINATVAGIASAQKLMDNGLASDRSDALAAMMRAEVERLQRLVADRMPSRRRSIDLDEVIGQIVLSHLARGRVVGWQPSGLRAMGRADDIAEVVNVLLENAAVHGGPDAVSVQVTRDLDGHGVTVTVTDQGPGVAPELRDRLFDWGIEPAGLPRPGHRPPRRRRHHPRTGRAARAAADHDGRVVRRAPADRPAGGERG